MMKYGFDHAYEIAKKYGNPAFPYMEKKIESLINGETTIFQVPSHSRTTKYFHVYNAPVYQDKWDILKMCDSHPFGGLVHDYGEYLAVSVDID